MENGNKISEIAGTTVSNMTDKYRCQIGNEKCGKLPATTGLPHAIAGYKPTWR